MSCCSGDDDDEQRHNPTHVRGCTDIFWLCCFIIFWFLMVIKFLSKKKCILKLYVHNIKNINCYNNIKCYLLGNYI